MSPLALSGPHVIIRAGKKTSAQTSDQAITKKTKDPYVAKKLKEHSKTMNDAISVDTAPATTETPIVVMASRILSARLNSADSL